jgi:hypothetical protein
MAYSAFMGNRWETLDKLKMASRKRILFLPHAVRQMSRPDRMIGPGEVTRIVSEGQMVEDYPDDTRGHSCLLMGFDEEGMPVHVLCAPRDEYLAIITAYRPSQLEWERDFKTRKRK